jgi:hypothetical protein
MTASLKNLFPPRKRTTTPFALDLNLIQKLLADVDRTSVKETVAATDRFIKRAEELLLAIELKTQKKDERELVSTIEILARLCRQKGFDQLHKWCTLLLVPARKCNWTVLDFLIPQACDELERSRLTRRRLLP